MNLDKVNQWLSLLGNLGVIVGIFFLAIELQNNTRATEAQIKNSMTENVNSWYMAIGTSEFATNAWYKGNNNIDELTPIELAAYRQIIQTALRNWENEFYQYQVGLYSEEEFEPRRERMLRVIENCGVQNVWRDGSNYSEGFRNLMNSAIENSAGIACN